MQVASSLLLLAALALVSAVPVEVEEGSGISIELTRRSNLVQADGTLDVDVLRGQLAKVEGKYSASLNLYEANTGEPHPFASTFFGSVKKRATASNALTADGVSSWYGTVQVGTPAKTFNIDFDTGSADFFLPSVNCSNCNKRTTYNPSTSSTSKSLGKTFSLSYGDGSGSTGNQYTDKVAIGALSVAAQTLGSAISYSSSFQGFPEDGVMGLGFPALSSFGANPFIFNLYNQKSLSSNVFSFKLSTSGASLFLGGSDTSKFTGSFSYAPVTRKAYWQVKTQSLSIGNTTIATNQDSIVDSGSTFMYVDSKTAQALYGKITGAKQDNMYGPGLYTLPCKGIPNNVVINFAGKAITIPASVFNLGQVSSTTCVGAIASANFGFWILGDVFMRTVYTQFDMANGRVGVATLA